MPIKPSYNKCLRATLLGDYEPELILHFANHSGVEMFFIKWKGWDHGNNTWVTVEVFDDYPDVLEHYLRKQVDENYDIMCQLGAEISDDNNLLTNENLIQRVPDVELLDLKYLTTGLIIKFLAIMHLSPSERRHEEKLIKEAQNLLQMCFTRLILAKFWEQFLGYFV